MTKSLINSRMRIGLLGGSFNPAHEGHLYISLVAMKLFKLHQIWWLVSPQNPLKSSSDMANYETRVAKATMVAKHPRIIVSEYEKKNKLRYSFQTTSRMKKNFNRVKFIWVMGGDNMASFHKWKRWQKIAATMPIAVFDREDFGRTATKQKASRIIKRFGQISPRASAAIGRKPPMLIYIKFKKNPLSATHLRNILGKSAFLG